ncbi:hypothetical protein [Bradyrhizobium sp. 170]|uniref:hypothetical protein n=1 Tax=Bradyrhizobium sp. 170 TaxID=2782641 RepID=UPI001FFE834A|nr:hypothetical protein [Bradyrhizobium sp. 170]UPK05628.1 hypothetical protein IVB05_08345 [Bradyrhizobium sp. 170]
MKDYTKVCSPEDFVRPSSGVSLLRGATNEIAARMGGKQTHLAEKRSAVPAWSTRALSQRVSLKELSSLAVHPVQPRASRANKALKFVLCRAVLIIIDPFRTIKFGDLASKSEGAHIDTVLFEFTEKRCMNEASAIWDLKGIIATISVVMCPGRRIQ